MHFGKYLKTAFLYHWNLLGFLGGMGFALVSGHPDVFCPLVLAAEVAYLGLLGTHPKFRSYVEAQGARAAREQEAVALGLELDFRLPQPFDRRLGRDRRIINLFERVGLCLGLDDGQNLDVPVVILIERFPIS